jgi:DNA-binding transcriptional ArsR family regulator
MSVDLPVPGTLRYQELTAAFAALEESYAPVPDDAFIALADPGRRRELAVLAGTAGRVLVEAPGEGWLTGYDDGIADRLAADGIGVLDPLDRAVLALVLLHTVVIPRAAGQLTDRDGRQVAVGTDLDTLAKNRAKGLSKDAINRALRRLRTAGIVYSSPKGGIVPGPQLRRLTPERNQRVWSGVMIATRPHGLLAQAARRQLEQRRSAGRDLT